MTAQKAVIVGLRRTAIGRARGRFRACTVDQLGAPVIRALLTETGCSASDIDEVWLGNALEGGNPARRVALAGGLPPATPAFTIDRQCTSGLDAILQGVGRVASGEVDAVLAGGVESCSTAPWRMSRPTQKNAPARLMARAPFSAPPFADPEPIAAADALASAYGVTRAAQDAYALRSHANACAAIQSGCLRGERVDVVASHEQDEAPRCQLTPPRLARLPPLRRGGTATVATVSPEADAAAIALIVAPTLAERLTASTRLEVVAFAHGGCAPALAGYAAVPAIQRLQRRIGALQPKRTEFNEAFAGQTLACLQASGLPEAQVCRTGGALAFGHPFGASGALLVCRLFHALDHDETGLAALAAMGGQGTAALFHRTSPTGGAKPDATG